MNEPQPHDDRSASVARALLDSSMTTSIRLAYEKVLADRKSHDLLCLNPPNLAAPPGLVGRTIVAMLTCKSPRKVMRAAVHLASRALPQYSSKFSRKDFTLPQLFACLVVKEMLKRSYRGAEAVLADSPQWLADIGLRHAPDHNTLCRAAKFLLKKCNVNKLLDQLAQWAAIGRMLELSRKPLTADSTIYDSHHVSRHNQKRCEQTRRRYKAKDREKGRKSGRSRTVRRLPKAAIAVASGCHLVLSLVTRTGGGADHPDFEPLVFDAWRRVPHRTFKVAADAGYDSEANHVLARRDMGLVSLIPPDLGRPRKDGGPPSGRWRRRMKKLLSTPESRKRSG